MNALRYRYNSHQTPKPHKWTNSFSRKKKKKKWQALTFAMLNKRLCFCYTQSRLALIVRILQQECILCMERIRWLSALISKQEETFKAAQSNFWPLDSKNTQRNKTLIYSQLIRLLWLICKQTIAYSADTQEKLIWHPINAKSLASLKVTLSLISTGLSTQIWSTYSWEKKLKKNNNNN